MVQEVESPRMLILKIFFRQAYLGKVHLSSVNYHSLNPNGFQEDGFLLLRSNLLELFPIPVEARAPQA
jgi:hypothetical protein